MTGFLFLLILWISGQKACAAVTAGVPGETYSGDYVVIVNVGTQNSESSGTLKFTMGSTAVSVTDDQSEGTVSLSENVTALSDGMGESSVTSRSGTTYSLVSYEAGTTRKFYTYNGYKTFTCIGEGAHCFIWMENDLKSSYDASGKTQLIAADMVQTYEQGAYEVLYEISDGNIPCRDGSGKLSIALEQIASASGVYMGSGNEPDITSIHINTKSPSEYTVGSMRNTNALLVHEGQHALFEQLTSYSHTQKYMGITEGMSVAAMEFAWGNSDVSNWLNYIEGDSGIRNGSALLYRTYRGNTAQDYGLPYLFIRYLINRKSGSYDPVPFFHAAYSVSAANQSADVYLRNVMGGDTDFSSLVTDFYTAIAANEPAGNYGFAGDPVVQSTLRNYPYYAGSDGSEISLDPTAGIILQLNGGTFTVPTDGGSNIRYRIVGEKSSVSEPAAGDGTAENPYQITSLRDWNLINNRPGAHYKLMCNLVLGKNAIMIGTFSGELDGNGHTVSGVTHPICSVNTGKICLLNVNADMNGVASNSYGMIAQTNRGLIDHCSINGKINAILYGQLSNTGTHTGAIAGLNDYAGSIQYCTVNASIILAASSLPSRNGGIAGANRGAISNCFFKGNLTVNQTDTSANVYAGGIAGETGVSGGVGGSISKCLNAGEITVTGGTAYVGQICGNKLIAYLENCYGKDNGIPLFGSEAEDANQTSSKKLTEEEWKSSESFTGLDFSADWQMGEEGPETLGPESITSIEVTGQPLFCYVGEELYQWGTLIVNGSGSVRITGDMVSGFDSSRKGSTRVLVRYMGKIASYTISVTEPSTVQSLSISAKPNKVTYVEGQFFDPSGTLLLAKVDGDSKLRYIRSGYTWNQTALKASDTSVLLSYYGASAAVPITVSENKPAKLEISEEQNGVYTAGRLLDLSEIRARITYSNGEKSNWITSEQFSDYQIYLAQKKSGSQTCTAVGKNDILNTTDSGSTYYLYIGNVLPGNTGAVSCKLGTMTVYAPLQIDGKEICLTAGRSDCYGYLNVSGGSGSYQTDVIKEQLPQGINRTYIPNEASGTFGYEGTTQQTGSYDLLYRVTDLKTKEQILVPITIHVQLANEVRMLSFILKKEKHLGLNKDVTGVISETQILLEVPEGTDITKLNPDIDYGAGAGADCNHWNGSVLDFTNPVTYILTAPDGVTKRYYEVIVKVEKQPENPTEPETPAQPENPAEPENPGQPESPQQPENPVQPERPQQPENSSQPETPEQPVTPAAAHVKLNATSLPLQVKKSTSVLKIKEKGANDSVAYWRSSNSKIVTVNSRTGKLTAKKTGKATITVTMKSGATAKCLIKVQKGKVKTKKIVTGKSTITLSKGQKYRIQWEKQPLTSTDKVSFRSAKKKTATVSGKGVIAAKSKGTTYITIKSGSQKKKIKIIVK